MKRISPTLAALALLAVPGLFSIAHAAGAGATPVAACGLEFDLPAGYKITRPKRTADARNGRHCVFDIVKAGDEQPPRGECKSEDEGGQPPFDVCDWVISGGAPPTPAVKVVRVLLQDHPYIDPFHTNDEGQWMLPNAHAGDQPATATEFFGKPAWQGEDAVRLYWGRERTETFTGSYAGTGSSEITLVQLAPDLFVQLMNPPVGSDRSWDGFGASLRLGKRTQDLP